MSKNRFPRNGGANVPSVFSSLARSKGRLALDAASRRRKDENGYLHVSASHLSKETVSPYLGHEIPGWRERNLDPRRVYHGYRSGQELAKGAATFNGLPLLLEHYPESAEHPQKEHRVGSLGTDAAFHAPYLDNSLSVTDAEAIRAIEDGGYRQLSAAYLYDPVFTPGVFEGQPYDFLMTNIRGNHVALVEEGRAGPDVAVADAKPLSLRDAGGGQAAPPPPEAPGRGTPFRNDDPAGPQPTHGQTTSKPDRKGCMDFTEHNPGTEHSAERSVPSPLPPTDGGPDPAADPGEDRDLEAVAELEGLLDAIGDEKIADRLRALFGLSEKGEDDETLSGLDAADEEPDGVMASGRKQAEDKRLRKARRAALPVMDAALIRRRAEKAVMARFREMSEAARVVRPVLGDIDPLAYDSADAIYAKALIQGGHNPRDYDSKGWRGMVHVMLGRDARAIPAGLSAGASPPFEGYFANLKNIRIGG